MTNEVVKKQGINKALQFKQDLNKNEHHFFSCMGIDTQGKKPSETDKKRMARFKSVAYIYALKDNNILNYDRGFVIQALMQCVRDGLNPDGVDACIIPYKGKVQYMRMRQGDKKMAMRSGKISQLEQYVIYEKEDFKYWFESDRWQMKYCPSMSSDKGAVKGTISYAKLTNGEISIIFVDEKEMSKIKSKGSDKNKAWIDFPDEMRKKSAQRRHCKQLPVIDEVLERFNEEDNRMYDFSDEDDNQMKVVESSSASSTPKSLQEEVEEKSLKKLESNAEKFLKIVKKTKPKITLKELEKLFVSSYGVRINEGTQEQFIDFIKILNSEKPIKVNEPKPKKVQKKVHNYANDIETNEPTYKTIENGKVVNKTQSGKVVKEENNRNLTEAEINRFCHKMKEKHGIDGETLNKYINNKYGKHLSSFFVSEGEILLSEINSASLSSEHINNRVGEELPW